MEVQRREKFSLTLPLWEKAEYTCQAKEITALYPLFRFVQVHEAERKIFTLSLTMGRVRKYKVTSLLFLRYLHLFWLGI